MEVQLRESGEVEPAGDRRNEEEGDLVSGVGLVEECILGEDQEPGVGGVRYDF